MPQRRLLAPTRPMTELDPENIRGVAENSNGEVQELLFEEEWRAFPNPYSLPPSKPSSL